TFLPESASTSRISPSKGTGQGLASPVTREWASSRWRLPPKTWSASAIRRLASSPRPATPSSPMPTMVSHAACNRFSAGMMTNRILILGGTTEARQLAGKLAATAKYAVTLSLAGRTERPVPQGVPTRAGGFGGADGLAAYLADEGIGLLIDATHPYAARISANAVIAAGTAGVPLLALRRPGWERCAGDRWTEVDDVQAAARVLGPAPRR